jgi:hypothetical protein
LAIGSSNETAMLNVSEKANWHSFIGSDGCKAKLPVQMLKGDDFLKDKKSISFIRMDVEGYELEVLRGLPQTLAGTSLKSIFLELHGNILSSEEVSGLLDILDSCDFTIEYIVHHDRPLLNTILPLSHLDNIRHGDKGTYELFFIKK